MSRAALPFLLLFTACASTAERSSSVDLESAIRDRIDGFHGKVGVYVKHLRHGTEIAIGADDLFPTASLIKVPILAALLDRVERGELDYHAELTYTKERLYPGEDILGAVADGSHITLAKVVMLMITTSDNTAALWCQEMAGTGTAINAWLEANGFTGTRMNSRTPGREPDKQRFGWGQTTPREMAELLVRIRNGTLVSPSASEEMHRCLSRIFWDSEALSAIPPQVSTMSKQGAVDHSRSEVVLVHAPHGDYVFCVITKDQDDATWRHDNEGFVLLREISAMLWRHFEPDRPFAQGAGAARYW